MNIIIIYALTKVHIYKGWNEINILYNYFQLMYFEVGGYGVGGGGGGQKFYYPISKPSKWNNNSFNSHICPSYHGWSVYQYIVNNTCLLLVFWLQMMLPLNTLSPDTLVLICLFPCIELWKDMMLCLRTLARKFSNIDLFPWDACGMPW